MLYVSYVCSIIMHYVAGAQLVVIRVGYTEAQTLPYMAVFRTTAWAHFIFRYFRYI